MSKVKVYALFRITDMSNYRDENNRPAPDKRKVAGIYSNKKKAEIAKTKFEKEDADLSEEIGFKPDSFEIRELTLL